MLGGDRSVMIARILSGNKKYNDSDSLPVKRRAVPGIAFRSAFVCLLSGSSPIRVLALHSCIDGMIGS